MDSPFSIYVIRHLPTLANQERKYIGWTDEPIAVYEGQCTEELHPDKVIGSDLLRARQTSALYFPRAEYKADSRWRECNFGEFEGKTYEDLENNKVYRDWIDDPFSTSPPNGENLADVESRVLQALSELSSEEAVVTHGGPMRIVLTKFSPVPKEFWTWNIPHGAVYRLQWKNEKAFKEGERCEFISAVLQTENGNM